MKLVPYNKMSKKAKKAYDAKKRGSWGNVKPVKRVSIPYGKGKARDVPLDFIKRGLVSIPYGKGKEQHFALRFYYNP